MQKRAYLFSAETYQASISLTAEDLPGCEYDIIAMQKRLLQIGFEVEIFRNAKKEDFGGHYVISQKASLTMQLISFISLVMEGITEV